MQTLKQLKSRPFLSLFEEPRKDELEKLVSEGNWNLAYLQANSDVLSAPVRFLTNR
jgi:hypothetical protein